MPYAWLQPAQAIAAATPAISSSWGSSPSWWSSSGQSLLSLFRPNVVGGRRSSLTSRLRNLMNALFYRRETSSPYLGSGSSYSYAFRPPPFGFSSSFPTTGLTSALGSQNLYGSASSYRPVVLPNYGSAPTDWSNYKQYASSGQSAFSGSPASWNSGSSGSGSGSNALWPSSSGQSGSGSQYSALSSSQYPSYSSGSGSSNSGYQAAASNVFPNTSYQRSSISSYSKPQTSVNTSVSSSVSSSSSSSSSSLNPKSVAYQTK